MARWRRRLQNPLKELDGPNEGNLHDQGRVPRLNKWIGGKLFEPLKS